MLPILTRGWRDEDDSPRDKKIVRGSIWADHAQGFLDKVVDHVKSEVLLKHIFSYVFEKQWTCNGCGMAFGFSRDKCGFDYWSENMRFRSRLNRFHFIPYLSVNSDVRHLVNYFCDGCYESIFGNVVSLFKDCVWRDTILFKCATVEYVADQWIFHTGGDVFGDQLVSFAHFISHIEDFSESGFVAFKLRHYDTLTRGSFKRTLLNKKIYSSERDVTSKARVDNYFIDYRRMGQEFRFWVEKDIAVELFGLMHMEGLGVWTEGARTFLFKNSVVYANACAMVISGMYPDVRRDVFRRMNIENDGRVTLIRNNETSDIVVETPMIPFDDLDRFSHLVVFLERILKETRY